MEWKSSSINTSEMNKFEAQKNIFCLQKKRANKMLSFPHFIKFKLVAFLAIICNHYVQNLSRRSCLISPTHLGVALMGVGGHVSGVRHPGVGLTSRAPWPISLKHLAIRFMARRSSDTWWIVDPSTFCLRDTPSLLFIRCSISCLLLDREKVWIRLKFYPGITAIRVWLIHIQPNM